MATLRDLAKLVGMDPHLVREILKESTRIRVTKSDQDRVFSTARRIGYDFKKLKIGKRMDLRKQVIEELLKHIESHSAWERTDILRYMRTSCEMVDRVQRKAFAEEFGAG